MKTIKYILLFSFATTLISVIAKTLSPFNGTNISLLLGILVITVLIPIYGILALIKKQHRIEAAMMCVSIPLIFGILFKLMNWPFGNSMIITGSLILLMVSIGILIYSINKKTKITLSILYTTIAFCSLAYCFKILLWPGSKALVTAAVINIIVAVLIVIKRKKQLTLSIIVSSIIILFFALSFIAKESTLYLKSSINLSKPELNHPEVYYNYAWILYNEGDYEKSSRNLEKAIKEVNNPNNAYSKEFLKNKDSYLKIYEKALKLSNTKIWEYREFPDYTKQQ